MSDNSPVDAKDAANIPSPKKSPDSKAVVCIDVWVSVYYLIITYCTVLACSVVGCDKIRNLPSSLAAAPLLVFIR